MCLTDQKLVEHKPGKYKVIRGSTGEQTFKIKMAKERTVLIESKKRDGTTVQNEYTLVSARLDDFTTDERYKNWAIVETVEQVNSEFVLVNIEILDAQDRHRSNAHAHEQFGINYINKTSAVENAATSALGRALRYIGIGNGSPVTSAEELNTALEQQKINDAKIATEKQAGIDGAISAAKQKVDEKKEANSTVSEANIAGLLGNKPTEEPKKVTDARSRLVQYYIALVAEKDLKFSDIMKRVLDLRKRVKGGEVVAGVEDVSISFTDFNTYYKTAPIPVMSTIFNEFLTELKLVDKYKSTPIDELLAQKK